MVSSGTMFCFKGNREVVLQQVLAWFEEWAAFFHYSRSISLNLSYHGQIGERSDHGIGYPQKCQIFQCPGISNQLASMEILGELVLSSETDHLGVKTNRIDYDYVANALYSVEAPGIMEYLSSSEMF